MTDTAAKPVQKNKLLILALIATLMAGGLAEAADSRSSIFAPSAPSAMDKARDAIKADQYERAIGILKSELAKNPNDADVNNLLGYSNRKLRRYDLALAYYQKALEINPIHRGANNYLAHLYLETNQVAKAEERLNVLDKACRFGCEEYTELKQALKNYRGPIASSEY